MKARYRIHMMTDKNSFCELFSDICSVDPLHFHGYRDKLEASRTASGEKEAVLCGIATICGEDCCIFAMEASFMMGSMGSAVGEKIASLFEYATEHRLAVIGFTVLGGARMQEGLLSLMQMAKTSAAVKRHSDAGLLYVAVLTDPTTGGVTASFAMEADIILAEPGATVGFAGKRVIEQTTKQSLPKEFQSSEFMLAHGFIDAIVPRKDQKMLLAELIKMHHGG
ncbi:MAG: acetyl-CoA carboxylase carboxyl transferase subunit beta [Clostridia bacterium]|nr:acetyl-CoA carboxylase carboxyl transferase subunit beta [Clostridia bacterium]